MSNVSDIIANCLERVKSRIQTRIAEEGRTASGKTSASLTAEVSGMRGTLYGSQSMLVIERGRKPGKVPYGFRDIIKEWIKAKGISVKPIPSKRSSNISPEERGLNSLAGAIAYNIMKKGTKLHREHGFNDIYTTVLNEEIELLGKELIILSKDSVAKINKIL